MADLNYATSYAKALDQEYPYVLNFGALYATPNNGRYRWGDDGKTIYIPTITTTGRVNSNRDTIATASRNYDNSWQPKVLTNQRKWSTLVHPKDIDQTNMVTTISNITNVYNDEQKFPEMDAYCVSKIYADWVTQGKTASTEALTADNVLAEIDKLNLAMTKKRVPPNGRILYVTPDVKILIENAKGIVRNWSVQGGAAAIDNSVVRVGLVDIIEVPNELMMTVYDFTTGWEVGTGAKQINMFMVHPNAVITPVSYEFAKLDNPSALTEGKYVYFEESFEDVFILNNKADAIQFNVTA